MSAIQVGCKINVLDRRSKWHGKSGIVEKLIWQSTLDGNEELASVMCSLDDVNHKVELKPEQVAVSNASNS